MADPRGAPHGRISMLAPPPGGLAPPPTGNPGSAPVYWNSQDSILKYLYIVTGTFYNGSLLVKLAMYCMLYFMSSGK